MQIILIINKGRQNKLKHRVLVALIKLVPRAQQYGEGKIQSYLLETAVDETNMISV